MKNYSALQAFILSFFSPSLYRDVFLNWRGIGFSYLFMLVVIVFLIMFYPFITLYVGMDYEKIRGTTEDKYEGKVEQVRQSFVDLMDQIPNGRIQNGEFSADVAQPYYMYYNDGKEMQPVVVIDTTGQFQTVEQAQVPVLITKDYMEIYNKSKNKIERSRFSEMKSDAPIIFSKDIAWEWVKIIFDKFKWAFFGIIIISVILGMYVYYIIAALIYGLLGLLLKLIVRCECSYDTVVRLACVAITPTMLVGAIMTQFCPWSVNHWLVVLIDLSYLTFALVVNRNSGVAAKA